MRRNVILGVVLSLGIALAGESAACPICIGFPNRTDADILFESHCILLCRPDPTDPFKYAPGAVLKGSYDGSNIDLLLDSTTDRLLQVYPKTYSLLVQNTPNGSCEGFEYQDRVVVCYGRLLERLPELAPQVAEDMHAWKRNELSEALALALNHRRDTMDQAEIMKVQRYLRSAKIAVSAGRPND